jgi:hypothetical protein
MTASFKRLHAIIGSHRRAGNDGRTQSA